MDAELYRPEFSLYPNRWIGASLRPLTAAGEESVMNASSVAPNPAFYTVPELALRWRVSERHVFRIIEQKLLAVIRIGRSLRIPVESVLSYEASLMTAGSS